jgi:hypothetical protein
MGFFTGRVTCRRFRVAGRPPRSFGPEQLEALERRALHKQRVSTDGVQVGWIAGAHILDTRFQLEKNIINDTLQFALRTDTVKLPSDLLRAYTQIELEALAADNPSGYPSAKQRRQARQAARERLEAEARDGRFTQRKATPILWDALSNELLVASTSATLLDRLHPLFQETFERGFESFAAGPQAFARAETRQAGRSVDDAAPAPFLPGQALSEVAWLPDGTSRDFLGNEFLLWLWHVLDAEEETVQLGDGSEVTVMFARTLQLECPRGQTGSERISSDLPTRLPEAHRAIQSGKLPRKAGLVLVRHDQQYQLTLHAETLAITSAKLPAPEGDQERARQEERVTQLRHLLETLDLLFDVFCERRLGSEWKKELARIQKWLQRDERTRLAASG